MANQLSQIVSYVDQLAEVDTETVEPMAHAMDLANIFEADVEQESLTRDEALANAPQADDECFLAPAVFGDR